MDVRVIELKYPFMLTIKQLYLVQDFWFPVVAHSITLLFVHKVSGAIWDILDFHQPLICK